MSNAIVAKVGVDAAPFKSGLTQLQSHAKHFAHDLKRQFLAVGASWLGIEAFREMLRDLDRVQKLSIRFGESAEDIQKVSHAAELAGAAIEDVAKSMKKATTAAVDATKGNKEIQSIFQSLGIDARKFIDMPLTDRLLAIAGGLENIHSAGLKDYVVTQLLGKSGGELAPLLSNVDELKEGFESVNVASNDAVDSIALFNDTLEIIKQSIVSGLANNFASMMAGFGFGVEQLAYITRRNLESMKKFFTGDLKGAFSKEFAEETEKGFQELVEKQRARAIALMGKDELEKNLASLSAKERELAEKRLTRLNKPRSQRGSLDLDGTLLQHSTVKPLTVDSLQRIGGGGGIGGLADPMLEINRRQTDLLQQIVNNTSKPSLHFDKVK